MTAHNLPRSMGLFLTYRVAGNGQTQKRQFLRYFSPGSYFEPRSSLWLRRRVGRPENLTNFGFALPARPVFLVQLHEVYCRLDGLLFRFELELRVSADNLLGLSERAIEQGDLTSGKPDARAHRSWRQPAGIKHPA